MLSRQVQFRGEMLDVHVVLGLRECMVEAKGLLPRLLARCISSSLDEACLCRIPTQSICKAAMLLSPMQVGVLPRVHT